MENKEPKGAYNRAPIFDRENYNYWKECMSVHIQSVDMDVWHAVVNGRFQPQIVADGEDGVVLDKPKADWSDDDKKKVQYDLKARNILIVSLITRSLRLCGMHWKPFTKEPMKLNNQKLIPLYKIMRFFAWKMVNPSPP